MLGLGPKFKQIHLDNWSGRLDVVTEEGMQQIQSNFKQGTFSNNADEAAVKTFVNMLLQEWLRQCPDLKLGQGRMHLSFMFPKEKVWNLRLQPHGHFPLRRDLTEARFVVKPPSNGNIGKAGTNITIKPETIKIDGKKIGKGKK